MIETKSKISTKKIVLCAMFTSLITVGAFIRIPTPLVPLSLQFLFTMLAGLLLGGKTGAASVLLYIAIGIIGIPVFTEGGGPLYIFKPSFGYIIGFVFATYATGTIANSTPNPSYVRLLFANFVGLVIVYLFGLVYYYFLSNFYLGTTISLQNLFLYCFALPLPGDIALCIICAFLYKRLTLLQELIR